MTNAIDVSCPQCQKKIKATEALRGKKVRCKGCEHIFTIPGAESVKPGPTAKPAARPAPVKSKSDDDDGPITAYGVANTEEASIARCPHCANEMESETARICMHCGYDTVTRQRVGTKRVYETTTGERSAWLLPGFLAIGGIVLLVFFDLFMLVAVPKIFDETSDFSFINSGGLKLWSVIISIIVGLGLGRLAFQRLVINPTPPEQTRG
jgi:hypothetical protein